MGSYNGRQKINNNIQLIIPTKKLNLAEIKNNIHEEKLELRNNGKSLIDENIQQTNKEIEPYIHENTKYYLNTVIKEITPILSQTQLIELVKTLCEAFDCVECIKQEHKGDYKKRNNFLLQEFHNTKMAESCSKKTLSYYKLTLERFIEYVDKHLEDVTTEDCERYLMHGVSEREWSPTTQDNVRRILNTFYEWAVSRRYIIYNPVSPIKPTKNKRYRVKKPFTNEDLIKMRDNCENIRDRAIMELFLSSGIRVAELSRLDKEDFNWMEKEFTVIGKGNKQRIAYFNEQAGYYLQKYIESRNDKNPAMFVTLNAPFTRLGVTGIETVIRLLGQKAGVTGRAHPHRFRHTFATNALNKGVPLEQVQQLLGHEQLDTTLIYAKVAREDVKYNHKKLMN